MLQAAKTFGLPLVALYISSVFMGATHLVDFSRHSRWSFRLTLYIKILYVLFTIAPACWIISKAAAITQSSWLQHKVWFETTSVNSECPYVRTKQRIRRRLRSEASQRSKLLRKTKEH